MTAGGGSEGAGNAAGPELLRLFLIFRLLFLDSFPDAGGGARLKDIKPWKEGGFVETPWGDKNHEVEMCKTGKV